MIEPRRHYANAPIVEAIIAIDVVDQSPDVLERLASIWELIRADFPVRVEVYAVAGVMQFGTRTDAAAQQEMVGYSYTSVDGKYVFETRLNGFKISRLRPYEGWETFSKRAEHLWAIYHGAVADSETVVAVSSSVRYINLFNIPEGDVVENHVRCYIAIPVELPQMLTRYFFEYTAPVDQIDSNAEITIRQYFAPSSDAQPDGTYGLILDMTVGTYLEGRRPWEVLNAMRDVKDWYFEEMLTPESRKAIG